MSLIFNALQRFARAEGNAVDRQEAKPANRWRRPQHRFFPSPGTLLILAGAIIITGLLAVQLVQTLSANARVQHSFGQPVSVQDEQPLQVATQLPEDAGQVIDAPASAPPAGTNRSSRPVENAPAAGLHPANADNSSQLVFYPPRSDLSAGGEPPQPAVRSDRSHLVPVEPGGGQDRSIQRAIQGNAVQGIPDRLAALQTHGGDSLPQSHLQRPTAAAPGITDGEPPLSAVEKSSYQESREITAIESKGALSEAAYRRLAARAAYQLNVTQLSHRIASAMQSQDPDLVHRLMSELEKAQGPDSLFLIRLKAYWQIQQNHLEKARELLEQVLARKPDDKESGVNLAVVDMRTGKAEPARRRLERLQRLYPEDDEIALALQKLHR
jgi:hypothetical protein